MLTVEVKSPEVRTKKGTSQGTGKAYEIREQDAYVDLGGAYPERFVIGLEDRAPFPAGKYVLTKGSLYIGRFNQLMVGKIQLQVVAAAARTG